MYRGVMRVVQISPKGNDVFLRDEMEGFNVFAYTKEHIELDHLYHVVGTFSSPRKNLNPGAFNPENYLFQNEIFLELQIDSLILFKKDLSLKTKVHWYYANALSEFPSHLKGFFFATLLGDKSYIPSETKSLFYTTGLGHFFALSGLHIGLLIFLFWTLLSQFTQRFKLRVIGLVVVLVGFILLVGLKPPLFRACVMSLLLLYARYQEKSVNNFHLLWIAAILNVIIFPFDVFKIGFWLSYSALFGILYGVERVLAVGEFYLPSESLAKRTRYYRYMLFLIMPYIATVPIVFYMFGKISLSSIGVNFLFMPVLIIFFYGNVFLALLIPFSSFLSHVYGHFLERCLHYTFVALNYFEGIPSLENKGSLLNLLFVFTAVLLFFHLRKKRLKMVFVSVIFILSIGVYSKWVLDRYWLHLRVFDVGQAQSILVSYKDISVLFDAGKDLRFRKSKHNEIQHSLNRIGMDSVTTLIVSHKDFDHYGNMFGIPIKNYYSNAKDSIFEKIPKVLHYNELAIFSFLSRDSTERSENNRSVVNKLQFGDISILFSGDIEKKREEELLSNVGKFLKSNMLIVPHHGSKTSSSPEFIASVQPDISVFSVGRNNRFKHPSTDVFKGYAFTKRFRTDTDSYLHFISNGNLILKIPTALEKLFF